MKTPLLYTGEVVQLNTTTSGIQSDVDIVALKEGGFVAAWTSQTATGTAIYARTYGVDGFAIGDDEFISVRAGSIFDSNVQLAAISSGGYVAVFQTRQPGFEVYAQYIDKDGDFFMDAFAVKAIQAWDQTNPSVISYGNGFLAAWKSNEPDGNPFGTDIYGRAFNNVSVPVKNVDTAMNDSGGSFLQFSEQSLTALEGGGYVVAYRFEDGNNTNQESVKFQIHDANDKLVGPEREVGESSDNFLYSTAPSIAGLTNGGFVVTWTSNLSDPDLFDGKGLIDVFAQIFDSDGETVVDAFLVSDGHIALKGLSEVKALPDGGFVVVWRSVGEDSPTGNESGIYAKILNEDGTTRIPEFQVDNPVDAAQSKVLAPTVAVLEEGNVLVSWEAIDPGTGTYEIFGRIIAGPLLCEDILIGDSGVDKLFGLECNDRLEGRGGADKLYGGTENDRLFGQLGDDMLWGEAGRDRLDGGVGKDKLFGGNGRDFLKGGKGDDLLKGGSKNDDLTGGKGKDVLWGGKGDDSFIFGQKNHSGNSLASRDKIKDFCRGNDEIDLSAMDAKQGSGNQAFDFVGQNAFSGVKGELRFTNTATKTIVRGDIDGDGRGDFQIELTGVMTLTVSDFVL